VVGCVAQKKDDCSQYTGARRKPARSSPEEALTGTPISDRGVRQV
jgi:hypothetical protein